MTTEQELRQKLRKIAALFEGATTSGERLASAAALDRVRKALAATDQVEQPVERQFTPIAGTGVCSRLFAVATG